MQQFALASVYPRSIAWLIRLNEWDRFNKIVQYNCAMVGGYFNVIIPLTNQDTLTEQYQDFLVDYDPGLIVLAPGMLSNQIDFLPSYLQPFGIISWESVPQIATLDPWTRAKGINAAVSSRLPDKKSGIAIVAVEDDAWPDTSRLAMVACGDIQPRQPLLDEDMELDAVGHREEFLIDLLKPEYHRNDAGAQLVQSSSGAGLEFIPAPNRHQLAKLILDEYKFPLTEAADILRMCCRVQDQPTTYQTFIGLTAYYKPVGTPERDYDRGSKSYPALVILVSDTLDLQEAILFWNLRAAGVFVSWLSFSQIESNPDEILKWLDYNYGGVFYAARGHGFDIAFSASGADFARLLELVDGLESKRQQKNPQWKILLHDDLVFYNYVRPYIGRERVLVTRDGSRCSFIPKLPQEDHSGEYTITLKWDDCMLPQNRTLVRDLISSEFLEGFMPIWKDGRKVVERGIIMPKFRITKERYLTSQVSSDDPVVFERPSPEQVVGTLFTTSGFSRIELSSTARYHKNFVDRAGGLEDVAYYLATSPYRELFEVLSDNSNKHKSGWILSNPSSRRALHHLHLRQILGKSTPTETKGYFDTVSDELPQEVANLLEKGILERGFLLKCTSCSFSSWYPAEHVGQQFECSRCFQSQVYQSNPLWLYKLREVIFQGFEDNMQVPLLALHQLRSTSRHHFEWVPDSDAYWTEEGKELHRNIDVLCLCDGKLYIGEAKSNDEIEVNQFSFYEEVCRRVPIDGIVFATSKSRWGRGTLERIERLKTWFKGEVIVLTGDELYQKSFS